MIQTRSDQSVSTESCPVLRFTPDPRSPLDPARRFMRRFRDEMHKVAASARKVDIALPYSRPAHFGPLTMTAVAWLWFLLGILTDNSLLAVEPPITALAFAPDGERVMVASQAGIRVHAWPGLQLLQSVRTAASNIHDLAFSPDGTRLAVAGGDPAEVGSVEILAWPNLDPVQSIAEHQDLVMCVVWRNNDSLLMCSLDREIIAWDTKNNSLHLRLNRHSGGVASLCLVNADTLVSAGLDQNLRVWNIDSGEPIRSLNNHTRRVHQLAVRPGETSLPMLASVSDDRTVRFWQPTIGRMVRFCRFDVKPLAAVWLRDGSRIAVACEDGHVRWVDPDTAEVTRDLPVLDDLAYSIAVHPHDHCLLIGGRNAELRAVSLDAGSDAE